MTRTDMLYFPVHLISVIYLFKMDTAPKKLINVRKKFQISPMCFSLNFFWFRENHMPNTAFYIPFHLLTRVENNSKREQRPIYKVKYCHPCKLLVKNGIRLAKL